MSSISPEYMPLAKTQTTDPIDALAANAGVPKEWVRNIRYRYGQAAYLTPGVERYPPLIMPRVPLARPRHHGLV